MGRSVTHSGVDAQTGGMGGGGTGDVSTLTSSSVDDEIALFSGTGGKILKRATTTGLLKAAAGVIAAATAGTDYIAPTALDTDGTLAANSDLKIATQKAVKTYTDTKQPLDSDLTAIAGLTATTDNILMSVASAWASRTPSQVKTALGLVIGTDVEAHDADLTTIAGLTPTNDDIIQRKAGAWINRSMSQVKTDLTLTKGDVGLGSVDNLQQLPISYLDTDGTLTANSDVKVASQKATKTYVDNQIIASGSGDVVGPSSSVDSEIALFNSTTGKLIKRATGSGIAKLTSGVLSAVSDATLAATIGALLYPIGSYYINETDSTNPATLLGFGTWSAITDKFIVGHGSTYTTTGGAATHTHALSDSAYAQIATFNSGGNSFVDGRTISAGVTTFTSTDGLSGAGTRTSVSTSKGVPLRGASDAGSTIPPYQAAYIWKRTA